MVPEAFQIKLEPMTVALLRTIIMSEEEEFCQVYDFIANHSYPTDFSKNQKRVLRRKRQ